MILAATIEITWPGVVVVLTAVTLVVAMLRMTFRSGVGHRVSEAIFAPILYELRTNDGGSLKDHVMKRFDGIEDRLDGGDADRAELHRKFDAEIARVKGVEREARNREDRP